MKLGLPIALTILLVSGCGSDPVIQRAKQVAAHNQSENFATFRRLERDYLAHRQHDSVRVLPPVRFSREIVSPFRQTRFLLFVETWIEPNSHDVVCSFNDTLIILPRDTSQWQYLDDSTLTFLNWRLIDERQFNAAQVLELFRFYNDLRDPGYGFQVTLDSWRDILWDEGPHAPEEVMRMIHEPQVQESETGFTVTGYVWDMGTADLRKVVLTYEHRSISLEATVVGTFGARHTLL